MKPRPNEAEAKRHEAKAKAEARTHDAKAKAEATSFGLEAYHHCCSLNLPARVVLEFDITKRIAAGLDKSPPNADINLCRFTSALRIFLTNLTASSTNSVTERKTH